MKVLILGGNRFFGKKLAGILLEKGHELTLLNRGSIDDGFGGRVERIKCDRSNTSALSKAIEGKRWDLVYDQVCYDYQTAKEACQVFAGKTSRYIYTSTQSVYKPGEDLNEDDFRADSYEFDSFEPKEGNYGEAKRQAEVGFHRHARFPVTLVRFPIVIGHDDYTQRFQFHVNRIKSGEPIYFPNPNAKISFVTSDFAAEALAAFADKDIEGPFNVASPSSISLSKFINIVEKGVDNKAIFASEASDDNQSPYGIEKDWYMNCDKLRGIGLVASEIEEWLPQLLK